LNAPDLLSRTIVERDKNNIVGLFSKTPLEELPENPVVGVRDLLSRFVFTVVPTWPK
jgi:hypothetical protein